MIDAGSGPAPGVGGGPQDVPAAPLALYRRYRPDSFAQVIGQEHVTEPLMRALVNNRVNHAYLFSGPRGCGKTTSARILARALNCEQGPTDTPCGRCQSCRDLARGGPGSLDVIEIDAASHGGVEDARDLRERAFYAPVNSRYKVYIVDEAHMVTTAGFNALLKLVEEPPPHVKFVFATTEPEKVIGTIRSRTHHYPFRLVPPKVLGAYLAELCEAEGIPVEPAVLPLVVRAGGGSVRDSLSVLDQLLGGASADGVSYAHAAALLGYTPDSLLDEMVDAFAAGDGASVFAAVDKVIEVGQDPRRFAEDLLRRLRDLVIVNAVPDAVSSGLVEASGDQAERLQSQAAGLGPGELARAAEVIAAGLTEMRGTTAPRLYLELMCARVLLPGADVDHRGVHARLDRLERRIGMDPAAVQGHTGPKQLRADAVVDAPSGGAGPAGEPVERPRGGRPAAEPRAAESTPTGGAGPAAGGGRPGRAPAPDRSQDDAPPAGARPDRGAAPGSSATDGPAAGAPRPAASAEQDAAGRPQPGGPSSPASSADPTSSVGPESSAEPSSSAEPETSAEPASRPAPTGPGRPGSAPAAGGGGTGARPGRPGSPAAAPTAPTSSGGRGSGGLQVADIRRLWPEVLEEVKRQRRFTWILLSQNSHVMSVDDGVLTLGLTNVGARDSFSRGGSEDVLREALVQVMGADLRVQAIVDDGTPPPPAEATSRPGRPGRPGAGAAEQPVGGPDPWAAAASAPAPAEAPAGVPADDDRGGSGGSGPGHAQPPPDWASEPPPDPAEDSWAPADEPAARTGESPAAGGPAAASGSSTQRPGGSGRDHPSAPDRGATGGSGGGPSAAAPTGQTPSDGSSGRAVRGGGAGSTGGAAAPTSTPSPTRPDIRANIRPTRAGTGREGGPDPDADARRDDTDLDESGASHDELLALHLGAELIAEEREER
ncbi:DNA polymerase III subunit gamma and tau [Auraticoccus monumenti]|uniref:DNA polymerase III subunit gamma and tau n=1 Tax=Auraticoccus monumenti TaxID=675864 RepID=UPI002F9154C4